MCHLRDYSPGDEKSVFRIVEEVLAEYGLCADPEETDADLRDVQAAYLSGGGAFKVIECDGRIAGSYGLYPTSNSSCELRKMYLLPEYRGRGLGNKMMEDAFYVARVRGFSEMTLETNSVLEEALNLYKKYGFSQYSPSHYSERCDLAMRVSL